MCAQLLSHVQLTVTPSHTHDVCASTYDLQKLLPKDLPSLLLEHKTVPERPCKPPDWCLLVPSHFSCGQLFVTPWTVAHQAPLSLEFSWQEYWHGLPFPSLEDPPNPGIEHTALMSPALAGWFFATRTTWEAPRPVLMRSSIYSLTEAAQLNTQSPPQ